MICSRWTGLFSELFLVGLKALVLWFVRQLFFVVALSCVCFTLTCFRIWFVTY